MRRGARVGAVAAALAAACNPTQGAPPVPVSASAPPPAAPSAVSAPPPDADAAATPPIAQRFGSVAVGYTSGYAVASPSCVYGWGENSGDGTNDARATPVLVAGLSGVRAVAAGGGSACALIDDGTVRCWGENDRGQLGDDTRDRRASPVAVGSITGAVEIAVGGKHACARLGDGGVRCWGDDTKGQLGDGAAARSPRLAPVAMKGVTTATQLATGYDTTCVVVSDGHVLCAGGGQPTAAPVAGLEAIADVSLGAHFGCARSHDGSVLCWGDGSEGALGRHPGRKGSAARVAGLSSAVRIAAGGQMACAVDDAELLRCWGHDIAGALNAPLDCTPAGPSGTACDTSAGAQPDPTRIAFLGPVIDVAIAMNHACARAADGTVTCWGIGSKGALGVGDAGSVAGKPPHAALPAPCK